MDELVDLDEILEEISNEIENLKNLNASIELIERSSKKILEMLKETLNENAKKVREAFNKLNENTEKLKDEYGHFYSKTKELIKQINNLIDKNNELLENIKKNILSSQEKLENLIISNFSKLEGMMKIISENQNNKIIDLSKEVGRQERIIEKLVYETNEQKNKIEQLENSINNFSKIFLGNKKTYTFIFALNVIMFFLILIIK
ncbi:coiled-coil domain-containing protein [Thermosipho sp. 1070]|uniref:coiled-coil domain-containing protein n=1 Tax=Thermosipho sp. 1070 TaxID=1437364 RepID=UPI000949495A|nr:hypothetical protein [Thermosipho sp. 1070]ANQ54532.1 hypothetical protein Y592_00015 [Thermosipho sp. 1070]